MTLETFVFVRHGEKLAKGDAAPLTARGEAQARAAGDFLKSIGVVPELVQTTDTARTQQTARLALEAMGLSATPIRHDGSGFGSIDEAPARLAKWIDGCERPVKTLLFVGHNTQQGILRANWAPKLKIPGANRGVVLVFARAGAIWRLRDSMLGSAG